MKKHLLWMALTCMGPLHTSAQDWLVDEITDTTQVTTTPDGNLSIANGLVRRTFTLQPNVACVSLDELTTSTAYLRSVRPEAQVVLDGHAFWVGGLVGQPAHNYLLRSWIPSLKYQPGAFRYQSHTVGQTRPRFGWMKHPEWMSADRPWPVPGKELVFTYRLDEDAIRQAEGAAGAGSLSYLKDVEVKVHYELYDAMPVFCKWITVENHSGRTVTVDHFKSEILAAMEPESTVDHRLTWAYPNITLDTDYNFGGMSEDYVFTSSLQWKTDSLYTTQVSSEGATPCLLEVAPKVGPGQQLQPGQVFDSFRVWELLNDSWDRERKALAYRRMMRAIAPWVTENPILMHVRTSDDASVRKAIDQCADVGFEMVIMTFWSGFNAEDESEENLQRMKALADYARSKGIALGGYSLLASRHVDAQNDVVMPEGKSPRFGASPCVESQWGQDYMRKLYNLFEKTGLNVFEHDGSYPGDVCCSTSHPGHRGLADSQWNQFRTVADFYHWCRSRGIYLNVPDLYFLNGTNKVGMGYRENNWSLPRHLQEIIERQNIYDGTWLKTPSMGWMFVPLVEYHGGGKEATIEPLKEHLPHYGQRLANLFGAGVQACYRGPVLYDAPETRDLVKQWVDFYKRHRQVLDGDIIHLRRPDGTDYDAILHVNPQGKEKGLLMVYNPLEEPITRTLHIDLYYTGLQKNAYVSCQDGKARKMKLDSRGRLTLRVEVPAKSQTWFTFTGNK